MPWRLSNDVDAYAENVWDLLAASPAENTVALTVIENVRAGRLWSEQPSLFGWYTDDSSNVDASGAASGAVSWTPPYGLLLAVVPPSTVEELVTQLRDRKAALPAANGVPAIANAFGRAWTDGTPLRATTALRSRLYALDTLRPPVPPPPGRARPAEADDVELATRWWSDFQRDTGSPVHENAAMVRSRVERGLVWLWADAGTVVSLAGRNRAAAGVARVGPVYTPPEHRRRGYGTAVTAACTDAALRQEAGQVVLFTDLSNPTSNAIYQRIGYRPVRDQHVVRFTEPDGSR